MTPVQNQGVLRTGTMHPRAPSVGVRRTGRALGSVDVCGLYILTNLFLEHATRHTAVQETVARPAGGVVSRILCALHIFDACSTGTTDGGSCE